MNLVIFFERLILKLFKVKDEPDYLGYRASKKRAKRQTGHGFEAVTSTKFQAFRGGEMGSTEQMKGIQRIHHLKDVKNY